MTGSKETAKRPPRPETPLELAKLACAAARKKKALDLVLMEVSEQTGYTDYLLLASGRSTRQALSIAESVERFLRKAGRRPLGNEGRGEGRWVLLDYGELIVHVFHEPVREFYNLESLWGDAERVELKGEELDRLLPVAEDNRRVS